jgi:cytochrome oxidase Cu insertion factor (SCO1/SenC/PrrC family)
MYTLQSMTRASCLALACALLVLCAPRVQAAPKGSPWNESYFPNVTLVSQDGKEMRFYDDMIKAKIVLINFMYATCHDACPLETAKLRQVQEQLGLYEDGEVNSDHTQSLMIGNESSGTWMKRSSLRRPSGEKARLFGR